MYRSPTEWPVKCVVTLHEGIVGRYSTGSYVLLLNRPHVNISLICDKSLKLKIWHFLGIGIEKTCADALLTGIIVS
jgi:hypothetical protein